MAYDLYENPLCSRYSGEEMKKLFSPQTKFSYWRKLWIALAESEKELGLDITDEQIAEMKAHVDDIDFDRAKKYESELRHDVMAHIRTFGDACPKARGIIHLGATSCFVGDNTDVILMREGLRLVKKLLLKCISVLADFAEKYKSQPTLSYTHFQAAQPTTLGKRATLWINDLLNDLSDLEYEESRLKLLGCKGTTGTSASFLKLFDGDEEKVKELERKIAKKTGFEACAPVSGQTYSRKVDFRVLSVLAGIAQSAAKFSSDIRLMAHMKEFDEPFESGQVGSSAMAYKRNPMRSERIASLSRYVITDLMNPAFTAASQWLERTLDDSANRRIAIPEAFLAVDGILSLYINIVSGGRVYPKMLEKHLMEELPFMATENILMHCVKKGGDRQELHEDIRRLSVEVGLAMKSEGKENDLLERILSDERFRLTKEELDEILSAGSFTGCAESQTEDFLNACVRPVLAEKAMDADVKIEIKV